jgi:hypothetical protein
MGKLSLQKEVISLTEAISLLVCLMVLNATFNNISVIS